MEDRAIVDLNTGTLLYRLQKGDRILREQSVEYLKSTILFNQNQSFTKVFDKAILQLGKTDCSASDYQVLIRLIPYVKYGSGLIADTSGNPIYIKDIATICNLSERTVYRAIEHLVELKVLAKNRTGYDISLYMNPYICSKGNRINKMLNTMFEDTEWSKLSNIE